MIASTYIDVESAPKISRKFVNEQLLKMSRFLSHWGRLVAIKAKSGSQQDPMTSFIVTDFSSQHAQLINIDSELACNSLQEKHLVSSLKELLRMLKSLFFSTDVFVIENLDRMLALAETTL